MTPAVPADVTTDLAAQKQELTEALPLIKAFAISTPDDVAFVETARTEAKTQWSKYEAERTKITKPLNAGIKAVNDLFRPVLSALKDVEALWSCKLIEAHQAKEAERAALLVEAQCTEATPEILRETLVAASDAHLETTQTTIIDRWVYEIVDVDKIPREYLCPNERMIGGIVAELKDKTHIPGVRVYNDPYTRSK